MGRAKPHTSQYLSPVFFGFLQSKQLKNIQKAEKTEAKSEN
jgi:hypothetical protein